MSLWKGKRDAVKGRLGSMWEGAKVMWLWEGVRTKWENTRMIFFKMDVIRLISTFIIKEADVEMWFLWGFFERQCQQLAFIYKMLEF